MKIHDLQILSSLDITGSFEIPIVNDSGSIPTGLSSGSIFFNKSDKNLYIASGSQNSVVGAQVTPLPPGPNTDIEYLVVAGGGGSGGGTSGGGGAGGLLSSSLASVESGSTFTITVGSGGAGSGVDGGNGSSGQDSSIAGVTISTITAIGGGGGQHGGAGLSGGSGGGAGYNSSTGGSGTAGQGTDGGTGQAPPYYTCGGGGGAAVAGGNASGYTGGTGGNGKQSSITGTATYYAGGGAGGTNSGTVAGGLGGGGSCTDESHGVAGTANTGGGASGPGTNSVLDGAAGGSGVVILAYDSGSFNALGGQEGDAGNGRKYHKFNTSGTFYIGSTSDFQVVTDGLEVFYNLANTACYPSTGTTVTDLSGNGHTGTFGGNPTFTNNYGGGVDLDGDGDYISVSNSSSGYAYSLDIWFYNDDDITTAVIDGPYQTLIELGGQYSYGSINLGSWTSGATNETIMFYTNASSAVTYIRDTVSSGIHNIAINWNGSQYDIWIDGVKKTTYATASGHSTLQQLSSSSPIRLGGETGGYTYDFDGRIFNFLLYTSTLTDSQVTQNYNALRKRFGL